MNIKIIFHLLIFILSISIKYSQFDAPKYWADLMQNIALQFNKIDGSNQYL
jgi:hypothetical protein